MVWSRRWSVLGGWPPSDGMGDNSPNRAGAVVGIPAMGIGVLPKRHDGSWGIRYDGVTLLYEMT